MLWLQKAVDNQNCGCVLMNVRTAEWLRKEREKERKAHAHNNNNDDDDFCCGFGSKKIEVARSVRV